ncbi:MAG: RNA polymerase sigma factor [Pirellulaceae bacterium]|nr:RNA polymerase sigma factor [Planctomycetales bacterium]
MKPHETKPLEVERIARQHFDRLHRAALVMTGSPWDADDLAQETFLVLSRNPQAFEGRSSLFTWLYGVLLNLERRRRRQLGMHHRKLQVLSDRTPTDRATIPAAETAIEVAQWKNSLWAVVAELNDGQRQALVLRFSEGLRYDEIAQVMGCPVGTVKSRISLGLAALREKLANAEEVLRCAPAHCDEDIIQQWHLTESSVIQRRRG